MRVMLLQPHVFGIFHCACHVHLGDAGVTATVRYEQCLVAENIDQARNTRAGLVDFMDGARMEQVYAGKPGAGQAMVDVAVDLVLGQYRQYIRERYALLELAQGIAVQQMI